MTRFVHIESPSEHGGVVRFEAALATARQIRRDFDGTRSLAGALLAAVVAAMIVVADQLIDTWVDGHLFLAWVALWGIAFAALALLAPTTRKLSHQLLGSLNAWSRRLAKRRADIRLMDLARRDPRVMADITAAMSKD